MREVAIWRKSRVGVREGGADHTIFQSVSIMWCLGAKKNRPAGNMGDSPISPPYPILIASSSPASRWIPHIAGRPKKKWQNSSLPGPGSTGAVWQCGTPLLPVSIHGMVLVQYGTGTGTGSTSTTLYPCASRIAQFRLLYTYFSMWNHTTHNTTDTVNT